MNFCVAFLLFRRRPLLLQRRSSFVTPQSTPDRRTRWRNHAPVSCSAFFWDDDIMMLSSVCVTFLFFLLLLFSFYALGCITFRCCCSWVFFGAYAPTALLLLHVPSSCSFPPLQNPSTYCSLLRLNSNPTYA